MFDIVFEFLYFSLMFSFLVSKQKNLKKHICFVIKILFVKAWEVFQKAPINMNLLMEKNAVFDNIIIPESVGFIFTFLNKF